MPAGRVGVGRSRLHEIAHHLGPPLIIAAAPGHDDAPGGREAGDGPERAGPLLAGRIAERMGEFESAAVVCAGDAQRPVQSIRTSGRNDEQAGILLDGAAGRIVRNVTGRRFGRRGESMTAVEPPFTNPQIATIRVQQIFSIPVPQRQDARPHGYNHDQFDIARRAAVGLRPAPKARALDVHGRRMAVHALGRSRGRIRGRTRGKTRCGGSDVHGRTRRVSPRWEASSFRKPSAKRQPAARPRKRL